MALTKCKKCGNEISTSAKVCPACGAPVQKQYIFSNLAISIVAVTITMGIVGRSRTFNPPTSIATPQAAPAPEATNRPAVISKTNANEAELSPPAAAPSAVATATGSSSEPGYDDGFIVGEARHNNKERTLDPGRLHLMASINAPNGQPSFLRGYQDGFDGKAHGGGARVPLPALPITISQAPHLVSKSLGDVVETKTDPLEVLAALVAKNPGNHVFVVVARSRWNKNFSEYDKFIYDSRSRHLLRLQRWDVVGENSFHWTLYLNTPPDSLSDERLCDDPTLRIIRSRANEAKDTVPLRFAQSAAITQWP